MPDQLANLSAAQLYYLNPDVEIDRSQVVGHIATKEQALRLIEQRRQELSAKEKVRQQP